MFRRTQTRALKVGSLPVGGGAPVSVQTMGTADPHDAKAILAQLLSCAERGCDLFRLTVPDAEAARVLFSSTVEAAGDGGFRIFSEL